MNRRRRSRRRSSLVVDALPEAKQRDKMNGVRMEIDRAARTGQSMPARILDGAAVAADIRRELSPRAEAFARRAGRRPGLSIVLVGDKPDSQIYVNSKLKSAGDEGIHAALSHLPASASLDDILRLVHRLNADPATDGILVQAPLPASLGGAAMQAVFDAIDPAKDVDGVTPSNVGRLVQNRANLIACTPAGIMELLRRSGIDVAGKHAVVIGRSDIVGKPVSMLLLHRHATVTVCHSRTRDLATIAASGDILVAALGRPGFVRRSFVRPGATVIDVGINVVTDESVAREIFHEGHPRRGLFERKGSVLVGDVHPEVAEVAGALTPVPGGVGPLTIAMLMANTIVAAELRLAAGAC
jgi:methylenetetrahydrofolate dehydrogenase (NADP+)/methenyltetrahydrofolate cyclohydrolase